MSSPASEQSARRLDKGASKEKRQASITPRKFTRFFTPRSRDSNTNTTRATRRILFDVTAATNNRDGFQSSPIRPSSPACSQENSPTCFTREMKRRKLLHSSNSTDSLTSEKIPLPDDQHIIHQPQALSDSEKPQTSDKNYSGENACRLSAYPDHCADDGTGADEGLHAEAPLAPVRSIGSRGLAGTLLCSRIGSNTVSQRYMNSPVQDWQDETSSFYSRPEDTHLCTSLDQPDRCIPFCVEGCNTNTLVAVGDEEGHVRLLESAKHGKPAFKDPYVAFRPHRNAIIDMNFSQDDTLLATASGDQSARVIDMATQSIVSVLPQHTASLKQVRFQPGAANNSVLATSSRDGSILIWDLRCNGGGGSIQSINTPLDETDLLSRPLHTGCVVNSIYQAHQFAPSSLLHGARSYTGRDILGRSGPPERAGDVSVTAIQFLPEGKEHLLLSASEANATVRLWDTRSLPNSRRNISSPGALSSTAQPQSHNQWRRFGISSLNLSGDASTLYSLCKDNTVYAYSMAHLILGKAPELSAVDPPRRRQTPQMQEGLGPIYGFRHPKLHVTSFYVKSAIRPARNGKAEMLAVGSSDGSTILIPTDERYRKPHHSMSNSIDTDEVAQSHSGRSQSELSNGSRANDIPISQRGTPLIRGHDREVGALTWTSDGELITVGDDFLVRCWREGEDARDLRTGGEGCGRRWGSGWADVPETYDDDDD